MKEGREEGDRERLWDRKTEGWKNEGTKGWRDEEANGQSDGGKEEVRQRNTDGKTQRWKRNTSVRKDAKMMKGHKENVRACGRCAKNARMLIRMQGSMNVTMRGCKDTRTER